LADVRVDLKKLFLRLGEATARVGLGKATGDWKGVAGGIITAVFGAMEAFSTKTPPGVLAWQLIRNGLTRALGELLAEALGGRVLRQADEEYFQKQIELAIGEDSIRIDPSFFQNPAALMLVQRVGQLFTAWLERHLDLPTSTAAAIAKRLHSYFAVAVHEEWQAHPDHYERLWSPLHGPLASAARWAEEWDRYHLFLVKQFDRPVFEEHFALSAVYVPLRACWEEMPTRSAETEEQSSHSVVVDLEDNIRSWLNSTGREGAIRLVRGNPGSGKSTFARKLAADLGRSSETRVLYFALQHFHMSSNLIEAVGEALGPKGAAAFTENPLNQSGFASRERPVLMIFDGLDELAQPGKDADEQTRSFLGELRFNLNRWNDPDCRVFALVTGRPATVQANRSTLRLPEGHELEVLPFLVTKPSILKREHERRPFQDERNQLEEDQRKIWWQKYVNCKAGEPDEIPANLNADEVRDLSAEPLLLYLLVLSGYHRRPAGEDFNRNELYAELFRDVAQRRYAGKGKAPEVFHELGENFLPVMEVIATAAWYGDGRTAAVEDIQRWCPSHIKGDLDQFLRNDAGTTRLIAAFYFQQAEAARRRDAIEFTHKSFGEYLTARRLVREVEEIHKELSREKRHYTEERGLRDWFELTYRARVNEDLLHFIRDEVRLRRIDAKEWQACLCRLLDWDLRHGMSVQQVLLSQDITLRIGEQQARNAEEALIAVINACARATEECSNLRWPTRISAGELILRIRGQREDINSSHSGLGCLGFMDFSGQTLIVQDLVNAELVHANLRRANLRGSNLQGANLRGANLEDVSLQDANLRGADLQHTNLQHANLRGANLRRANLEDADLRGANLQLAPLQFANLQGANLQGANLVGANLQHADLWIAKLQGANLQDANLSGANLDEANLQGADLQGADLQDANLRGANLQDANLSGANLDEANLEDTKLEHVRLPDVGI
jgi:uncharacterized protein YjbI with pentapeptide repeats